MYYKCNFNTLTAFLEAPRQIKTFNIKNQINRFDLVLNKSIRNPICYGSCEAWVNKKICSKFRPIISDQNKRSKFEKNELKNIVLKTIVSCNPESQADYVKVATRLVTIHKTYKPQNPLNLFGPRVVLDRSIRRAFLVKAAGFSKIRNRCILTAKSTALFKFGLSRIMFRKLAGLGKLPGVVKTTST
jgi:ribosomal protein S14